MLKRCTKNFVKKNLLLKFCDTNSDSMSIKQYRKVLRYSSTERYFSKTSTYFSVLIGADWSYHVKNASVSEYLNFYPQCHVLSFENGSILAAPDYLIAFKVLLPISTFGFLRHKLSFKNFYQTLNVSVTLSTFKWTASRRAVWKRRRLQQT